MSDVIKCFERLELTVDKAITFVRFTNPDGSIDTAEPLCIIRLNTTFFLT